LKFSLNGKEEFFKESLTVAELINLKGLNPDTVVVEYNRELVKKEHLAGIVLKENDRLEILRFVGGG
jgi:sulfur carrier protein